MATSTINFPGAVLSMWENWSEIQNVNRVPTAAPADEQQLVELCNYAAKNGLRVRPTAARTNWSPLTFGTQERDGPAAVCADLTKHFSTRIVVDKERSEVTVDPCVTLEKLVVELNKNGLALNSYPGYGQLTIAGMVATGSHGWVAPSLNPNPNVSVGSLANVVVRFRAVVSQPDGTYIVKSFTRGEGDADHLLVSFGRTIFTELTLKCSPQFNIRALSNFDYDFATMFGPPPADGSVRPNSYQDFVNRSGRCGAVIIPFTDVIWTRVLSYCPTKPEAASCRAITELYPYTFGDAPAWAADAVDAVLGHPHYTIGQKLASVIEKPFTKGAYKGPLLRATEAWDRGTQWVRDVTGVSWALHQLTPYYMKMCAGALQSGNASSKCQDLWGPSHLTLMYVKSTFKIVSHGVVVVVARKNVQKAVNIIATKFKAKLAEYAARREYPYAAPLEFRSGGLDMADAGIPGAKSPSLSPAFYDKVAFEARGWDTAINVDFVSMPTIASYPKFMSELMAELMADPDLSGDNARIVPEWAKYFACDAKGPWRDQAFMTKVRPWFPEWRNATQAFERNDNKRIFTNPWLDEFFLTSL